MNILRFGIPLIGSAGWAGGTLYSINMAKALLSLGRERPRIIAIIRPDQISDIPANVDFLALCDAILLLGDFSQFPIRFPDTLTILKSANLEVIKEHVDFIYPTIWDVQHHVPNGSWIPDFQHHVLPEFFSAEELTFRTRAFDRIANHAKLLVVSSEDSKRDFAKYYPHAKCDTYVLHFASQLDAPQGNPRANLASLAIPERFLLCSNQFWSHKNHITLFRALGILKRQGVVIPLVCTGAASDYRNQDHYNTLLKTLDEEGIRDQVQILGFIPREQQISLIRCCMAMVQPSLFEGWSTVLEDARTLGCQMIASDLAVHKEQNLPGAYYFERRNPNHLAQVLSQALPNLSAGPDLIKERHALTVAAERLAQYGKDLVQLAEYTTNLFQKQKKALTATVVHSPQRPLIATSIAPHAIEKQQRAIQSWVAQGFDVLSLNIPEEIEKLKSAFPEVLFKEATRDARSICGKPLVALDDILDTLSKEDHSYFGIVNSDIEFRAFGKDSLSRQIISEIRNQFLFVKRIDFQDPKSLGSVYDFGVDAFFFHRAVLEKLPRSPFWIGLPWWDYFLPAYCLLNGIPTAQILSPFAYHPKHDSFYDSKLHWAPYAIAILRSFGVQLLSDNQLDQKVPYFSSLIQKALQYNVVPEDYSDNTPMGHDLLRFASAFINWISYSATKSFLPVPQGPAIDALMQNVRSNPNDYHAFADLARHFYLMGKVDTAKALWQELQRNIPQDSLLSILGRELGIPQYQGNAHPSESWNETQVFLQKWKSNPVDPQAKWLLSEEFYACSDALSMQGKYGQAKSFHLAFRAYFQGIRDLRTRDIQLSQLPLDLPPQTQENSDYLVTAIVSVYKAERFMRHRLDNLVRQTLGSRLEIIVIDANSPENEKSIVEEYQKKHSNIIYHRTPDREKLYASWSRAAKMARGKYLTNANADDVLRLDALERLAQELDAHPEADLAYADFWITNRENQDFADHVRCGFAKRPSFTPEMMLFCCYMGPQPMWRRSVHERIGYFDEKYLAAGDYEFWVRMVSQGMKLHYVPEFLGVYFHNPQGICNSNAQTTAEETREIVQRYAGKLPAPAFQNPPAALNPAPTVPTDKHALIALVASGSAHQVLATIRQIWNLTVFPYRICVIDPTGDSTRTLLLREALRHGEIHSLHEVHNPLDFETVIWNTDHLADYIVKLPQNIQILQHFWLDTLIQLVESSPKLALLGVRSQGSEQMFPLQEKDLASRVLVVRRQTLQNLGVEATNLPDILRKGPSKGAFCIDVGVKGQVLTE